ncbi:MAG: hypothetical protein GTO55_04015, partial [Armatimonadetes bacterium]|nr:hypothetical protein [Armatimonadota bacterium]NIM23438.1 hypothetical protein [Armatimonadota bacterium]NIM67303.1 hypothetical protein [Armatimonadota bacterium]NIM75801.1 hypothetical protein [Armatimonadota bacterium]NIN05489.1 hypothetical protein [Armatimonadota bacterium]
MAKPRPETSRTGGVRGCARRLTAALVLLCLVPLSALAAPRPSPVQPSPSLLRDDSLCLGCHGDTVDVEVLHASTHEGLACVDCHQGVETVPHAAELPPTDCDRCHYQESLREFPAADAEMTSLPSIHQAAREEGAADVPTCITCHGTHEVRPALAGVSAADKMHMVGICNNCHPNITDEYLNSIHGEALAADIADSPACADCHPEHSRDAEENGRDVFRGKVVTTCSSCHEDPGLQRRYALPGNRLGSYLGSYHGTATQLGDVRAANCFSCHGAH